MAEDLPIRSDFPHFLEIPTRWMDQDPYGHVNNVEYYSYFDTVVNEHLIRHAGLVPRDTPVVGMVVETKCRFLRLTNAGLRESHVHDVTITREAPNYRGN